MPIDRLGQPICIGSVVLSLVSMRVFIVCNMDIVYSVGRCIDYRYPSHPSLVDEFRLLRHFKHEAYFEVLYDIPR